MPFTFPELNDDEKREAGILFEYWFKTGVYEECPLSKIGDYDFADVIDDFCDYLLKEYPDKSSSSFYKIIQYLYDVKFPQSADAPIPDFENWYFSRSEYFTGTPRRPDYKEYDDFLELEKRIREEKMKEIRRTTKLSLEKFGNWVGDKREEMGDDEFDKFMSIKCQAELWDLFK